MYILACTIIIQWVQNTNFPCQQSVLECGFRAGPQSNWLITQLINRTVNGTRLPQVSVKIEFELRNRDTTLNCHRTFNTHVYETPSMNTTGARLSLNNYQQVRRVSPDVNTGARVNETVTITFSSNHSSFYFALQDETSCIAVTRLIVFYYVCPQQTVNLFLYPETISPPENQAGDTTHVSHSKINCVANAEPEDGLAPLLCSSRGIWNIVSKTGCRCVVGYFHSNEMCERKQLIYGPCIIKFLHIHIIN